MSEASVEVPAVGRVRRTYVYGAGALVAGYVGWRYWQARQSAAADAPAPESAGTIGADIGSGTGGYYDPNGSSGIASASTANNVVTSDQEWYARAMLALEDAGYGTGAAAVALGKYLRTEPLTAAEQDMVRVALAAAGPPPSGQKAIVDGNPPSPSGLGAPQRLRAGGTVTPGAVPLRWDAVAGAGSYAVYRGDSQVAIVGSTSYTAGGLHPHTAYSFTVRARNSSGNLGPASAAYRVTTPGVAVPVPTTTGKMPRKATPKPGPPKSPAIRTIVRRKSA